MLFKNIKKDSYKHLLWPAITLIIMIGLLFFIIISVNFVSKTNQDIFAYTIKVRDAVEKLDMIFERAEVNVSVMVDSIANSYNTSKQQDKVYNFNFIEGIDGLVKSVSSNSPGVDGAWFQVNADLPFSAHAYNWYEFRESQFIDVKDRLKGTPSMDRKITPDDDPYYFDAITRQKPTWSDIYTDPDTKNAMMTISAPISKEGILVGVVGIDISVDNLKLILKDMQSTLGESDLYLLDKKNNVILSQLFSDSNLSKGDYQFLELFEENGQGPIEYYDNLKKKTAIMLTLSNDYKIVIAIENKTLFSETRQIFVLLYLLFVLLVVSTTVAFINQFKTIKMNEPKIVDKEIKVEATQADENDIDFQDRL